MFMSTSTSPAAGSGASMSNACIAAQTASSCISQPRHWRKIAPASGNRRVEHGEALARHDEQLTEAAHALVHHRAMVPACPEPGDREEREPDPGCDQEGADGPVWHLGRREHPDDEDRRGNEVEEPVREHGPDERRARPGRRAGKVPP